MVSTVWILINALLYFAIGCLSILKPHYVAEVVGYSLTTPGAIAELKACYGGLMIAISGIMIYLLYKDNIPYALLFTAVIYLGFGAGRIIGIIGDQAYDKTTLTYVSIEIFSTIFSYFLYMRKS